MKRAAILLLIVALSGTLLTCNKEYIGDYDANYIGDWHSDTLISTDGKQKEIYMIINGKNSEYGFNCDLNCTACECQLLTSGKAMFNDKKNSLTIGSGNGNDRVKLNIITHPYQDTDGRWRCVVDAGDGVGVNMYRK